MNASISSKIARYARINGISYHRAASIMGKRAALVRQAKGSSQKMAEENERRFKQMRESRPDLY